MHFDTGGRENNHMNCHPKTLEYAHRLDGVEGFRRLWKSSLWGDNPLGVSSPLSLGCRTDIHPSK